jgi:hypothetical protein
MATAVAAVRWQQWMKLMHMSGTRGRWRSTRAASLQQQRKQAVEAKVLAKLEAALRITQSYMLLSSATVWRGHDLSLELTKSNHLNRKHSGSSRRAAHKINSAGCKPPSRHQQVVLSATSLRLNCGAQITSLSWHEGRRHWRQRLLKSELGAVVMVTEREMRPLKNTCLSPTAPRALVKKSSRGSESE